MVCNITARENHQKTLVGEQSKNQCRSQRRARAAFSYEYSSPRLCRLPQRTEGNSVLLGHQKHANHLPTKNQSS